MEEAVKFDKVGRIAIILVIIGALLFGAVGVITVIQEKNGTYVVIQEFMPELIVGKNGVITAGVQLKVSNAYSKTKYFKLTVKILDENNAVVATQDVQYKCDANYTGTSTVFFETRTSFANCHAVLENIVIE